MGDINKAIEIGPDFSEAHHALGNVYDQRQDFTTARKEYNIAIELSAGQEKLRGDKPKKKLDFLEKPDVDFSDVAGLRRIKEMINEAIVYPLKKPELAEKYGKTVGGGIIFYGPPGCGKTYLGKATAGECNASFLNVKITDVVDMYVGNTEKNIHNIFEMARKNTPAILFFDEIDGFGGRRDATQQNFEKRAINQFLTEMDGVEYSNEGVLTVGSSNAPWYLDPALRRAGRFSKFIYFPEPDKKTRKEIFKIHMRGKPIDNRIDFSRLARLTEGYSAADIKEVCDVASAIPWKEALESGHERKITMQDFLIATVKVKSSIPQWYTSVKKFLIKEYTPVESRGEYKGGVIVVKHTRAQDELLSDEERALFRDLARDVAKKTSSLHRFLKKTRVSFAWYVI